MSTCFVCLEPTRNRKCDRCSLHCHPKCWGMYVKSSDYQAVYVREDDATACIKRNRYVRCPQCRGNLSTGVRTRLSGRMAKEVAISSMLEVLYNKLSDSIQEVDGLEQYPVNDLLTHCGMVLNLLRRHSWYLKSKPGMMTECKRLLKDMYDLGDEVYANDVYFHLFGTSLENGEQEKA